jgi:hypothetical protein
MSDPFKVSVLDMARDVTTIDGFETAGRANRHVERINVRNDGLHAEYIGDSRDRVYAKKAARVAEVQAERIRESKLRQRKTELAEARGTLEALREVLRWLDNTGHLYSTDSLVPHLRDSVDKAEAAADAAPDLRAVVQALVDSSPGPQYKKWIPPGELLAQAQLALAKVRP